MSSPLSSSRRRASLGLSLIELLVGVAIGLIGVVAIFQAVTVWTKHTQTTNSGSDAQVAGTLALFNLERDLKLAGHGFGTAANTVMGCNVLSNAAGVINMRPVEITPGVLPGDPDTISILAGNSPFFAEAADFVNSTATTKQLARRGGFRIGDVALVAGPVPAGGPVSCMFVGITDDTNVNGWISHDAGAFPASLNLAVPPAFVSGKIFNLGPNPSYDVWTVTNSHTLNRIDRLAAAPAVIPVADGIVNMKAEYGYDADGNCQIDPVAGEWVPTLPAGPDWTRVLAVRIAVLVRGRQFERNPDPEATGTAAVTPTARSPTYFGGKPFLMRNVDGTPDGFGDNDAVPNNWRYYRYRVYERVIPLRNMVWGQC
jgi:type IV pilus assembly protein PilW